MGTFFSELVESLKPSIVVLFVQVIKDIFAQGADYVHEYFTLKKRVEMAGGVPTIVGYNFHVADGWKVEKVVDLSTIEGAQLDETLGVIDISFVKDTPTNKIVRIENLQYYLVKI